MTRPSTASVTMSTTTPPQYPPFARLCLFFIMIICARVRAACPVAMASAWPALGHQMANTAQPSPHPTSHSPSLQWAVTCNVSEQERGREREKDLAAGSSRQSRCLTLASSPSSSLSEGRHLTHDADSVSLRVPPHPAASLRLSVCPVTARFLHNYVQLSSALMRVHFASFSSPASSTSTTSSCSSAPTARTEAPQESKYF